MPSQLLHVLFGEDVSANMGIDKIVNAHKSSFALGCQGPDLFYHNRRRRPVGLEYGTLLHRRGVGSFSAELLRLAVPANPADGINALGVYALGFMTHALLDRAAHPYIVYKTWFSSKKGFLSYAQSHTFFERIIDSLMLEHLRGMEVRSWDQDGLLAEACRNPPPGLKDLLFRALVSVFPERAGKDEKLQSRIENTFLDSANFYRMTAPAFVEKESTNPAYSLERRDIAYIYPEKLPQTIDFLNLEKRPWFYPAKMNGEPEKEYRLSFLELYTAAVKAAVSSLSAVVSRYLHEGIIPAEETSSLIGNGGLSIADENGLPCAPSLACPLPLDKVLDQQAVLRRCTGA